MFLYSPDLLKLLKFAVNYAHFFRVLPFEWDTKAGQIRYAEERKGNWYSWKYVRFIFLLQVSLSSVRYYQSASEVHIKKLTSFVFESLLFSSHVLIAVFQIAMIHKGRALGLCANRFLMFFKKLQGRLHIRH
jgi:hypothetical protein